jgi:hypothetical protein
LHWRRLFGLDHRLRLRLFSPLVRRLVLLVAEAALVRALAAVPVPARTEAVAPVVAFAPLALLVRSAIGMLEIAAHFTWFEAFRLVAGFGCETWAFADLRLRVITLAARLHFIIIAELVFRPAILLLHLLLIGLGRGEDAQIMLRMLIIALGHHYVAGDLRVAPELEIFVGHRLRRAAHLYIGPVALIDAIERVSAATSTTAAIVTTIPAAAPLVVLPWSHFPLIIFSSDSYCPWFSHTQNRVMPVRHNF